MYTCSDGLGCKASVCSVGFANCNTTSPDCETAVASPAAGTGGCLPQYLGSVGLAIGQLDSSVTAVAADGSFFIARHLRGHRRLRSVIDGQGRADRQRPRRVRHQVQCRRQLRLDRLDRRPRLADVDGARGDAAGRSGRDRHVPGHHRSRPRRGPGHPHHQRLLPERHLRALRSAPAAPRCGAAPFRAPRSTRMALAAASPSTPRERFTSRGISPAPSTSTPAPAPTAHTAPVDNSGFVVKLDSGGNFAWAQVLDDPDCSTFLRRSRSLPTVTSGRAGRCRRGRPARSDPRKEAYPIDDVLDREDQQRGRHAQGLDDRRHPVRRRPGHRGRSQRGRLRRWRGNERCRHGPGPGSGAALVRRLQPIGLRAGAGRRRHLPVVARPQRIADRRDGRRSRRRRHRRSEPQASRS